MPQVQERGVRTDAGLHIDNLPRRIVRAPVSGRGQQGRMSAGCTYKIGGDAVRDVELRDYIARQRVQLGPSVAGRAVEVEEPGLDAPAQQANARTHRDPAAAPYELPAIRWAAVVDATSAVSDNTGMASNATSTSTSTGRRRRQRTLGRHRATTRPPQTTTPSAQYARAQCAWPTRARSRSGNSARMRPRGIDNGTARWGCLARALRVHTRRHKHTPCSRTEPK